LRLASELKNRLLHIFRLEAKALSERPAKKGSGRKSRERSEDGRGYNWQGVRRGGKDTVYDADGTLAGRAIAGLEK
jgi:hypothetical protein